MPILPPWSGHELPDGSIEVRRNGLPRFIMKRSVRGPWELCRFGASQVIERSQYRNDLFSGIESGRITEEGN